MTTPRMEPTTQRVALEALCEQLLRILGYDPDSPALEDTPGRWARWWQEFINYQDRNTETAFVMEQTDQMVVVSGIRVWSICEHHLLPFWCDLTLGYVARGRVLGLSKLARIAHLYAHKLQLQERLVKEIGAHISRAADTPDVGILASGEHLCLTMRGARTPHRMKTAVMLGTFRTQLETREEFYHLARGVA